MTSKNRLSGIPCLQPPFPDAATPWQVLFFHDTLTIVNCHHHIYQQGTTLHKGCGSVTVSIPTILFGTVCLVRMLRVCVLIFKSCRHIQLNYCPIVKMLSPTSSVTVTLLSLCPSLSLFLWPYRWMKNHSPDNLSEKNHMRKSAVVPLWKE